MIKSNEIYHDDGINIVKQLPDDSIDLIVIDPPYGKLINELWDDKNGLTLEILNEYFRIKTWWNKNKHKFIKND